MFTIYYPTDALFPLQSTWLKGYNSGMDDEFRKRWTRSLSQKLQDWAILVILAAVLLILSGWLLADFVVYAPRTPKLFFEMLFGIAGFVVAAFVIRSLIQAINRRDDPRLAKRPPDDP